MIEPTGIAEYCHEYVDTNDGNPEVFRMWFRLLANGDLIMDLMHQVLLDGTMTWVPLMGERVVLDADVVPRLQEFLSLVRE